MSLVRRAAGAAAALVGIALVRLLALFDDGRLYEWEADDPPT